MQALDKVGSFKHLDANDPRKDRKESNTSITTTQGTIKISELEVPEDVKDFLETLDFDGEGTVHKHELEEVISLLKKLKYHLDFYNCEALMLSLELVIRLVEARKKDDHEMEYLHLPEGIQRVFRVWDSDGSGKVDVRELTDAARVWEETQDRNRFMRWLVSGVLVLMLVTYAGLFSFGMIAAEFAKEFKAGGDGASAKMVSKAGDTMQTANSDYGASADGRLETRKPMVNATCPTRLTCSRRLNSEDDDDDENTGIGPSDNTLRMAQSLTKGQLSSTLPDSTFADMKAIALEAKNGNSLNLEVESCTRVIIRSSLCGSVVHLQTAKGRLTLDDYQADADEKLLAHAEGLGMGHVFRNGSPLGQGRRLSSSDGTLAGFFNLLDDIQWKCESQPLPNPTALSGNYMARCAVKQAHESESHQPGASVSSLFVDTMGQPLDLAGIEREGGRVLKTWTETFVILGDVRTTLAKYAMAPYTQILTLRQQGLLMQMVVESGSAYHCRIAPIPAEPFAEMNDENDSHNFLSFMGTLKEDGLIIRRFRMQMDKQLGRLRRLAQKGGGYVKGRRLKEGDEIKAKALLSTGTLADYMDYFDIDDDSSGKRLAGDPYRFQFGSTVQGAHAFTDRTYLSVTPLASVLGVRGVLDTLGIKKMQSASSEGGCPCVYQKVDKNSTTRKDWCKIVSGLPKVGDAPPATAGLMPWNEAEPLVATYFQKLVSDTITQAHMADTDRHGLPLELARRTKYWSQILDNPINHQVMRGLQCELKGNCTSGRLGNRRLLQRQNAKRFALQRQNARSFDTRMNKIDKAVRMKTARKYTSSYCPPALKSNAKFQLEFCISPKPITILFNLKCGRFLVEFSYFADWDGYLMSLAGMAEGEAWVWPAPAVIIKARGGIRIRVQWKDKSELISYWDFGGCGSAGNDYHYHWCKSYRCVPTKSVPYGVCGSRRAVLDNHRTYGIKDYKYYCFDSCCYYFYARYICDTSTPSPKYDLHMSAYWDWASCGPGPNNQNWGMCNKAGLTSCPNDMTVQKCPGALAYLDPTAGGEKWTAFGCWYRWFAQYVCDQPPKAAMKQQGKIMYSSIAGFFALRGCALVVFSVCLGLEVGGQAVFGREDTPAGGKSAPGAVGDMYWCFYSAYGKITVDIWVASGWVKFKFFTENVCDFGSWLLEIWVGFELLFGLVSDRYLIATFTL